MHRWTMAMGYTLWWRTSYAVRPSRTAVYAIHPHTPHLALSSVFSMFGRFRRVAYNLHGRQHVIGTLQVVRYDSTCSSSSSTSSSSSSSSTHLHWCHEK
jgi:hypothetical protein